MIRCNCLFIGRVGITTVNSETRITVDGARVTELCSQPLAQDLQMALQQLVSRNNSSIDHRRNHRRKTRSHLIDPFIAEAETEMDALINEINARIRVAEDQRRAIQLAKARFTNTIQEKLGSNFTIQSIIVVDNNCILVNGKPINKLLL